MCANRRLFEVAAGVLMAGFALGQETQRVSVAASGGQLTTSSGGGVISGNGRYILFVTSDSDVVDGDTNGYQDVFIRDRIAGTTERVSVGAGGVEANGGSGGQRASADGRFVVFKSDADNLVSGDTNATNDIFVRDRWLGTTERVNVASDGTEANAPSLGCAISADGRYVSFLCDADNLVSEDTNGFADVFVHDRQTGTTIRVNVESDGTQANHASFDSSISGDGRYVAFTSWATNFGPTDANGTFGYDIFVHDCITGTTRGVSVDPNGAGGNADSTNPSISADGRYVAFESGAWNLLPGVWNGYGQVYVRDLLTGTTSVASLNSSGILGDHGGVTPSISSDGRYVAFASVSRNFVGVTPSWRSTVYLRDHLEGTIDLVSVDSNGVRADEWSDWPSISADGRLVAFGSLAANLVPGDTNNCPDIFVHDPAPAAVTAFCFGDGTESPCPCGNNGGPLRGCQNSATTGGAVLGATGLASLGQDTLRITCYGQRASALGVFIQSDIAIAPINYGDGLRCIGGSLMRLYARNAMFGMVTVPDGADPSISERSAALGDPIPIGGTRHYQVFYRDPAQAFCPDPPGSTFNVSNAISAVWDP